MTTTWAKPPDQVNEGPGSSESRTQGATRTDAGDSAGKQEREDSTPTGKGLGIAYAYLNRRERTVAEVRARLERADVSAEEIDEVILELLEFGYLDDARYARVFTEDKRTLAAWGSERIERSLRERGVERDLIEAALAEAPAQVVDATGAGFGKDMGLLGLDSDSGVDSSSAGCGMGSEFERAVALLNQRFPSGPAVRRDRERAFGVLARKGYESEVAADAVREWARCRTA